MTRMKAKANKAPNERRFPSVIVSSRFRLRESKRGDGISRRGDILLRHWKWALQRHVREPGWEAKLVPERGRERRAQFVELVAPAAPSLTAEQLEVVLLSGRFIPSHTLLSKRSLRLRLRVSQPLFDCRRWSVTMDTLNYDPSVPFLGIWTPRAGICS